MVPIYLAVLSPYYPVVWLVCIRAPICEGQGMNIAIPKSYWRIFLMIFIEVVFCFLLYHAFMIILHSNSPHPWIVGDWLINYQGGLVRRGLIGEIAFQVSQSSGIDIVILIVVFQTLVYLIFLINSYRLSTKSPFSPLSAILIGSPAFILFPILDPIGAFRKEILLFALLSALCIHLVTTNNISRLLPVFISAAGVFIALSHEMLIVYFPYIIAALIIYDGGFINQAKKGVLAIVPAIAITIPIMIFSKGDVQTVKIICNSLRPNLPLDCLSPGIEPGAISFLGEKLSSAHDFVIESLGLNTILTYIVSIVLAFTPLVLMYFSKFSSNVRKNINLKFWLVLCILSAIVGSIPLFWVVADYGRLVYIHVTCLTILMLMGIQENVDNPLRLNINLIPVWALAFLYITGWRLIHWRASLEAAFPILAIFERFFNS